jgi:hypothetical protein
LKGAAPLRHKRQAPGPHSAAEVAAPAPSPHGQPLSKAAPSPLARTMATTGLSRTGKGGGAVAVTTETTCGGGAGGSDGNGKFSSMLYRSRRIGGWWPNWEPKLVREPMIRVAGAEWSKHEA